MKLWQAVLAALPSTLNASETFREVRTAYESIEVCGHSKLPHNGNSTIHKDILLEKDQDSCVYRVKADLEQLIEIVDFELDLDCDDGNVMIYSDNETLGPYCSGEKRRRRRNAFGHSHHDLQGHQFASKELDLVFSKIKAHHGANYYHGFKGHQAATESISKQLPSTTPSGTQK